MNLNSLIAYANLIDTGDINIMEAKVLRWFIDIGRPVSCRELSEISGIELSSVAPRVTGLLKKGVIEAHGLDTRGKTPRDRFRYNGAETAKKIKKEKRMQSNEELMQSYNKAMFKFIANPMVEASELVVNELKAKVLDRMVK